MKRNLLAVLMAALGWIILSCGSPGEEETKSAAPPMPTDVKEFIEVKCTMCHFTDRIYKEKRYPMEWISIVNRMKAKNPTWISQEDADKILDYLMKNNSESKAE
jgi:hypothetical protein